VLDALEYAHKQGIVHRDIKPENILLHGGHAMVADFGIALAASKVESGQRMTETGMSLGTPHYMSPEQAMGEREITPKADIYALGAVLYEMLSAEPPFVGATAQAIFARVLTDEPRSITLQRKTVPQNVADAVGVTLQKPPADRFASAAQFAEALGKADFTSLGTRVSASASSRATTSQGVMRAVPWALFVLAATFSAYPSLRSKPAPVTRQQVVLWKARPAAVGAVSFGLAIARDGAVVFVDTIGGIQQLWIKERDQLEPRALTGTIGAWAPVFSPDGKWIAFASEGKLKKVPPLGGSATAIADSLNTALPTIAWLDDGTVAFNDGDYRVRTVNQDGGPTRVWIDLLDSLGGAVILTPLPGGRGVLVGACTGGCAQVVLTALDLRSGAITRLGDEIIKAWYTFSGQVVSVRRDAGVFTAPFDLKAMSFASAPVPVLDGVRTTPVSAEFAMSPSGTVPYEAGASQMYALNTELLWVERDGKASLVDSRWSYDGATNGRTMAISPDARSLTYGSQSGSTSDIHVKQLDKGPSTRLTLSGNDERAVWSRTVATWCTRRFLQAALETKI